MDESWVHYTKWNESDSRISCVESKKTEHIDTENKLVVARGGGQGGEEMGNGSQKVQTYSFKKVKF